MGYREHPSNRFWRKVEKTPTCWLWRGAVGRGGRVGYGVFRETHDRIVYAHRYAYERLRGPIPEGWVVDHLCGNPACVNPDHLEAVTVEENGRRGKPRPMRFAARDDAQGRLFDPGSWIL